MTLDCIAIYIIVELFECSSNLFDLHSANLPKFQRRLYMFSNALSYLLNLLIGSVGIYFLIKYRVSIVYFILLLFLLFWIRDLITGTLVKLVMIHFYNRRATFLKDQMRKEEQDE